MQPRGLRKTDVAVYRIVHFEGENYSGIEPIGDRVLILPDQATEKSLGGAFLDPQTVEHFTEASETGVIVACGPDAFLWNADRTRRWEGEKPKPGDRVAFERYAGQKHHSWDGQIYRLVDDKTIGAREKEVPAEVIAAFFAKKKADEAASGADKSLGQLMTEALGLHEPAPDPAAPAEHVHIPADAPIKVPEATPGSVEAGKPADVAVPRGQSERIGRVVEMVQAKEDYLCRIAIENPAVNLPRIVDKVLETLPAEPRDIVEAVIRRKLGIKG